MAGQEARRASLSKLGKPDAQSIYQRPDGTLEVTYRDEHGRQRWQTISGGISAARAFRDAQRAKKNAGEVVGPNRMLLGEATTKWLEGPVESLSGRTRETYKGIVTNHVKPAFGSRRLDKLTPDDLAKFVRDLRAAGMAEWTITGILGVVSQTYRYAARSLKYRGVNPVSLMLASERPKQTPRGKKVIFTPESLAQTIDAARDYSKTGRTTCPWDLVFVVSAMTGARLGEVIGLRWRDVELGEAPGIDIATQLGPDGQPRKLKTESSKRVVPIPDALGNALKAHKAKSDFPKADDPVFATCRGTHVAARNTSRALRESMRRAVDKNGDPTFPILSQKDESGEPVKVPRGVLPTFHSFRHTFASRALADGESVDEIAFLLGHADGTVTRRVYVQEVADERREKQRRQRVSESYAGLL